MSDTFPTFPVDTGQALKSQFETEGKGATAPEPRQRRKRGPNKAKDPAAAGQKVVRAKRQPRVAHVSPSMANNMPDFEFLGRLIQVFQGRTRKERHEILDILDKLMP